MGLNDLIAVLWRRRWLFALGLIACFAVVVVVTLLVPRAYEATATLYVGGEPGDQVLDTSQGEQLTRTFTALASNPATADAVLERLDSDMDREELLKRMSFAPVERTPLLQITARDSSARGAANLANDYAEVFVESTREKFREGLVPTPASFSERAVVPDSAASPNVPLFLGFGFALSLLLAGAAALLADRLDRRLRVAPTDESLLGLPILARVPTTIEMQPSADEALNDPAFADALRNLRTGIELAPGSPVRALMVTGSGIGEGKSTIAAQLALATARDGDRVTLVECDLRRPSLDFAGARGRARPIPGGLSDYLAGRVPLEDVLIEERPGLHVIYSGGPYPNPARLLRSQRFVDLIKRVRADSDWVVIDTPPVPVAGDALLLTPLVDGAIMVADAAVTEAPRARAAVARLESVGARVVGLVLNRDNTERRGYYYYATDRKLAREKASR